MSSGEPAEVAKTCKIDAMNIVTAVNPGGKEFISFQLASESDTNLPMDFIVIEKTQAKEWGVEPGDELVVVVRPK